MEKETLQKQPIKVCIVEDDQSYADSIIEIIQRDNRIKFYGLYRTAEEFLRAMESPFQPDVCLMDIVLKDMTGLECGKIIKEKYPHMHIIIMTAYPNVQTLSEARKIGSDYIEKGPRIAHLINRIITTTQYSNKNRIISLKENGNLELKYVELAKDIEEAKKHLGKLSDTQLKIIKLRKQGKSVKEIAHLLGITAGTVHTHISRAKEKLQLPDLIEYLID